MSLNSETLALRSVSGELYSAYLGGSILHSLKKDNKDPKGSTWAGMKAAVRYYKKHKDVIGEKETFEKYVRLLRKGKLRKYLEDSK